MQVENAIAFAVDQEPAGLELRINFGVFAGRDATSAELEELGKLLVSEAGEISIVGEERHELSEDAEVVLRQVRVSVAPDNVPDDRAERRKFSERLVTLAEIWARQCISERHAELTESMLRELAPRVARGPRRASDGRLSRSRRRGRSRIPPEYPAR